MADILDDVAGLLRGLFVCGIACAVVLCIGAFMLGRHAWKPRTSFAWVRVQKERGGSWTEVWRGQLADVPCSNGVYTIQLKGTTDNGRQ